MIQLFSSASEERAISLWIPILPKIPILTLLFLFASPYRRRILINNVSSRLFGRSVSGAVDSLTGKLDFCSSLPPYDVLSLYKHMSYLP